jgi:glycosyltransferase involved in cell wall biosynthesis
MIPTPSSETAATTQVTNLANASRSVLLVADHFHPVVGGAETLVRELAAGLAAGGDRVHVLTQRVPRDAAAREVRDGYSIERLWVPPVLGRLWFLLFAGFYAAVRGPRADLVHAAGYASMWPARLAAWWRGVPAVATVYEVLDEQWYSATGLPRATAAVYRWLERRLMRLPFARYLCISRYTADRLTRLAGVASERIVVVYPAVDYQFWQTGRFQPRPLRQELGLAADSRVALFFGRPGVSKGVDTLLAAAVALSGETARPMHWVLLLAREPAASRAAAEQTVARHRLSSQVTILDSVPRAVLPSYLLAADCVVIPSLSEGFGYSAIEAATLGCPLVVTAGHVFEEVLGDFARYVPAGDPAALAQAVQETAWERHPNDSSRPPLAAKYSLEQHLQGTRAVYDSVLAESVTSSVRR